MSKLITPSNNVKSLIAYWNVGMDSHECVNAVKNILRELGRKNCKVTSYTESFDAVSSTGMPPTRIRIKFANSPREFQTFDKATVRNFTEITLIFRDSHGFYSTDKHDKFNAREEVRYVDIAECVKLITEKTAFDGHVYECRALTNAKARNYRTRCWYSYGNFFAFSATVDDLLRQVTEYLYNVLSDVPETAAA